MTMHLTIGEAAKILRVSIDTLRRWDESGMLKAERKNDGYRYYSNEALEVFLKNNLFKIGFKWAGEPTGQEPPGIFYCQNSSVFQARLSRMEAVFRQTDALKETFSLLVAITGEIGNNAFDHNIGNWSDIPGLFFGYDVSSKQIVLADRGQGIFKTLHRVKPELRDDHDALKTAFTEVISGRAPEKRGNGLKYVKLVVEMIPLTLFFQTGNAALTITTNNSIIKTKPVSKKVPGCIAFIQF